MSGTWSRNAAKSSHNLVLIYSIASNYACRAHNKMLIYVGLAGKESVRTFLAHYELKRKGCEKRKVKE